MTSNELRQKFIKFQEEKGHKEIPNLSLVPESDPSLLFVNSGMFPLVPYLSGKVEHPLGTRLVNIQRCVRADGILDDIMEVGDTRHFTFFEMIGNWSLGDYFKKEQLNNWYEFLIEILDLDPKRIYQTVYAGNKKLGIEKDTESVQIIKEIFKNHGLEVEEGPAINEKGEAGPGIKLDFEKQHIFAYRDKNWWQRGDAVGELGGPDSETFYDTGKPHDPKFGKHCHINCDCGRFLEIGNSVFMQYKKTETGWETLKNKNVDFGGGLERLLAVAQKKDDIYQTDVFWPIIQKIEEISGIKYQDQEEKNKKDFRVIADHIRASVFLTADGVEPSNKDQGYVLRRLIRRAVRIGRKLNIKENFLAKLIPSAIGIFKDYKPYSHLEENKKNILVVIEKEETAFRRTLEKGLKEFEKYIMGVKVEWEHERGTKKLETYFDGNKLFQLYETYGFPLELAFEEIQKIATEIGLLYNEEVENKIKQGFKNAQEEHQAKSRAGSKQKFTSGLADKSEEVTKYHTATHLLHTALKEILGPQVAQKGSNITGERLRFDFNFDRKLTEEEKKKIEDWVNDKINKDACVMREEMSMNEAKDAGAVGLFDAKYSDKVSVYTISEDPEKNRWISKEICTGPHAKSTGELGEFKIKKEQSAGAGIRRIKAVLN